MFNTKIIDTEYMKCMRGADEGLEEKYICVVQNYLKIHGNLKITVYEYRKTSTR